MLQTSPYWLSQYGNVATAALAAAAATNPTMSTPTTTPFDIYYRQAAAALQQKHQNSAMTPTSEGAQSLAPPGATGTPLYGPPGSHPGRFNPLYLNSLPPAMLNGVLGSSPDSGLLMPLNSLGKQEKDELNSSSKGTKTHQPESPTPPESHLRSNSPQCLKA